LAVAEGAVLTVKHPDSPTYHDTVRISPELTRLDLVSKAKFLVSQILPENSAQRQHAGN